MELDAKFTYVVEWRHVLFNIYVYIQTVPDNGLDGFMFIRVFSSELYIQNNLLAGGILFHLYQVYFYNYSRVYTLDVKFRFKQHGLL